MTDYSFLPEPLEHDLGNGIVALYNAYSFFVRGSFLGVEYVDAHKYMTHADPTPQPFNTGHILYVCPDCGEIWARKVLRAFPLWEAHGWIVEVVACDGAILANHDEALKQPVVLLQALDAYLRIFGAVKTGMCRGTGN